MDEAVVVALLVWIVDVALGGGRWGGLGIGGVGFLAAKFPRLLSSDLIFLRFPFCFFHVLIARWEPPTGSIQS